jgi:hypothetical protein
MTMKEWIESLAQKALNRFSAIWEEIKKPQVIKDSFLSFMYFLKLLVLFVSWFVITGLLYIATKIVGDDKPVDSVDHGWRYNLIGESLYIAAQDCAPKIGLCVPSTPESLRVNPPYQRTADGVFIYTYKFLKSNPDPWQEVERERARRVLQDELEAKYRAYELPPAVYCLPCFPVVIYNVADRGDYAYAYVVWNDNEATARFLERRFNDEHDDDAPDAEQVAPQTRKEMRLFYDKKLFEIGRKFFATFDIEATPMWMLIGASGTGKTVAGKIWLFQIVKFLRENVGIWVLDFKMQDYEFLKGKSQYFAYDQVLDGLRKFYVTVFEARQSGECQDLTPQILVIEELPSFLNSLERKDLDEAKRLIANLLMLGRSRRCHILSISQTGHAEYHGKARDNYTVRVALGRQYLQRGEIHDFQ